MVGDIYSLGVLLYQLMTGSLPHDTLAQVLRYDTFVKPKEINSAICIQLEEVILRCLQRKPEDRFATVDELKAAFTTAAKIQTQQSTVVHLAAVSTPFRDWSSEDVDALENTEYQKAASIANAEFRRSKDTAALLQQLNALYRSERWFDFEKVINGLDPLLLSNADSTGSHMRELTIKVLMKIRKLDKAQALLGTAKELGDESFELDMCEASIDAMEARQEAIMHIL